MARKRRGGGIFGALDLIEAVFYVGGGLVVLVVGIIRISEAAHRVGGTLLVCFLAAGLAATVGFAVRDAIQRRWSPASIVLAAGFAASVGIVMWFELTGGA